MNVLFVGNSYTMRNDLPATVAAMCADRGIEMAHARYLRGGASLKTHWLDNLGISGDRGEFGKQLEADRAGKLDEALGQGCWDWVVIQGQSRDTLDTPDDFRRFGRLLHASATQAGARVMFYLTWARQHLPHEQPTITDVYTDLACELGAEVAPVGPAWARALEADGDLVLHVADQSHPTDSGSYLAACVLFRALLGGDQSPVGLPYRFDDIRNSDGDCCYQLSADRARFLQEIAAEGFAE